MCLFIEEQRTRGYTFLEETQDLDKERFEGIDETALEPNFSHSTI